MITLGCGPFGPHSTVVDAYWGRVREVESHSWRSYNHLTDDIANRDPSLQLRFAQRALHLLSRLTLPSLVTGVPRSSYDLRQPPIMTVAVEYDLFKWVFWLVVFAILLLNWLFRLCLAGRRVFARAQVAVEQHPVVEQHPIVEEAAIPNDQGSDSDGQSSNSSVQGPVYGPEYDRIAALGAPLIYWNLCLHTHPRTPNQRRAALLPAVPTGPEYADTHTPTDRSVDPSQGTSSSDWTLKTLSGTNSADLRPAHVTPPPSMRRRQQQAPGIEEWIESIPHGRRSLAERVPASVGPAGRVARLRQDSGARMNVLRGSGTRR